MFYHQIMWTSQGVVCCSQRAPAIFGHSWEDRVPDRQIDQWMTGWTNQWIDGIAYMVLTILKNIRRWEGLSHIWWKIKNVPNHQPEFVWSTLLESHLVIKSSPFDIHWTSFQHVFFPERHAHKIFKKNAQNHVFLGDLVASHSLFSPLHVAIFLLDLGLPT